MTNNFPEFHRKISNPDHPIFKDISARTEELVLQDLLELINKEMEAAEMIDPDILSEKFQALLHDLINAKGSGILTPLQSDFIRLRLASELAEYFSGIGRFSLCFDWLLCALTDANFVICEGGEKRDNEFFLDRIDYFFNSADLDRIGDARKAILIFFCTLYYYSWKAGGLRELATLVLSRSTQMLLWSVKTLSGLEFEIAVVGCCHLSSWSEKNNREDVAKTFIPLLETTLNRQHLPTELRKIILVQLCTTTGKYSSRPFHEWASQALQTVRSSLIGHEYLQVLLASFDDIDSALIHFPEVLKASRDYVRSIRSSVLNQADFEYKQARLFEIIRPFIVNLLGSGKNQEALQILGTWYEIRPTQFYKQPVLSILPNLPTAILYVTDSKLIEFDRDSISLLREVTAASNRCLGVNIILTTDSTFQDFAPPRPGVPDPSAAAEFERALEKYYELNQLLDQDIKIFDSVSGLLLVQATQHPIQALLRKSLGKSWPIITSYHTPMPERQIKKILFMSMGTISADAELEAVKNYFSHWEFLPMKLANLDDKEKFLDAYGSDEYDLIWIEGHGEYNPISPHQAHLPHSFEKNLALTIEELQTRIPISQKRRLLVLNICSGSNVMQSSGPGRLGIAAMLSGGNQCVISHLWPIKSFVAATFGAALARALASNTGFFVAFENALDYMRLSREELLLRFSSDSPKPINLIERLENGVNEFDAKNILNWGSPVFFE